MTHFEVRKKFIEFFKKNSHVVLPGSSLISKNDPSLFFVNAGMNQFKNIFLNLESPPAKNAITVQKCLRAGGKHNDIEEVGETPLHHTFFEMLGNFSFGDYFKEKAISLAWNFLTQELALSPDDLWVTVHNKDEESYEIWQREHNIPAHKIYRLGDKDNFWQMGDTGPCGYCSEIHYYKGNEKHPDHQKLMEVWNLVFMEFDDQLNNTRQRLPNPCVDTGMGLERLCALLQGKKSNYHTDLFSEIIRGVEQHCNFQYDFEEKQQTDLQKSFRVIADHSRAVSFLISEGVVPGNEGGSYVLRRIMRRALYYSQKLNPKKNLLQVGTERTISLMEKIYSELKEEKNLIHSLIEDETKKFSDSLKTGRKKLMEKMKHLPKKHLTAEMVWDLYSTYGFPIDLTRLFIKEKGWTMVSEEEIEKYKSDVSKKTDQILTLNQWQVQKKELFKAIFHFLPHEHQTKWTAYDQKSTAYKNKEEGTIQLILSAGPSQGANLAEDLFKNKDVVQPSSLKKGCRGLLVLDKTCFYPEGGGPVGDIGWIKAKTGQALVVDCQKQRGVIVHEVEVLEGEFQQDQLCQMEVNVSFRKQIALSHTVTHLLNAALRTVLGDNVRQAGSLVEPGRLRFDFTYSRPLTKKQCQQVEEQVWQSLQKEENICSFHKSFNQAKAEGVLYLQGENYSQEKVRVVRIGQVTSTELCGGIHAENTKEIEHFKIISEKGVQSGVRRIIAYTGYLAQIHEDFLIQENYALRARMKAQKQETEYSQSNKQSNALVFIKEKYFWTGFVEERNPFLNWIEHLDKKFKNLREKIIQLEGTNLQSFVPKTLKLVKVKSRNHPFAYQNLELREYLKVSFSKEKNPKDFFLKQTCQDFENSINVSKPICVEKKHKAKSLEFHHYFESPINLIEEIKTQEQSIQTLQSQLEKISSLNLKKDKLIQQAKGFVLKGQKGKLLVVGFPLEDRKILSELSDSLLLALSSGVLILLGEGEGQHPIFVSLTKDFHKILSAVDILKNTIVPLGKGRGGGKISFAQGSILDRFSFSHLEKVLLEQWS